MTSEATSSRRDIRMDGVAFYRVVADAPLARRLALGSLSYCVAVRHGWLTFETEFPVPSVVELQPGDVVAFSGLASHLFRAGLSEALLQAPFETRQINDGGPAAGCDLIVGVVPSEALALGSMTIGPVVVRPQEHPDLSRRLWRAIEMLEDEYGDDTLVDRELIIRRLAEIMLVNMTRRILRDRPADLDDVLGPQVSRQIVQALNAFLDEPDRPWTLDQLARAAGMSRTRFAETFKALTGQTPGKIVARLRLTAIARRLSAEALSIERAAEEAGYSSSAAFVRAFQREFGETPARWRRAGRGVTPIMRSEVRHDGELARSAS